MIGLDVEEHLPNLAHEMDRLVERHHQVTFGEFNLCRYLGHSGTPLPCPRRAIEVRVVSLRNGEALAALLTQHRVLDVLDPATGEDEAIRQNEAIAIAEFAVERKPREEFGKVFWC